jgi:hypothetical protein
MNKPSKAVLRLPLHQRAEIAFKVAVAKAIDEHTRLGLPVYVESGGRVIELSPDDVKLRARNGRRNGPKSRRQ